MMARSLVVMISIGAKVTNSSTSILHFFELAVQGASLSSRELQ